MKIAKIEAKRFSLELLEPVRVAIGELTHGETVLVKVTTVEGLEGIGEASGIPFVTGEDCESVLWATRLLAGLLVGCDVWDIAGIHQRMDAALQHNTAAKAGIDIALYDLMAKAAGQPLYRFLGGARGCVETDKTISISTPQAMAKEAARLVARGFGHIKVKAGLDAAADVEAIRQIRAAVGPKTGIKVDANQGWTVHAAVDIIRRMAQYDVQAVEQPLPSWDIEGLACLRPQVPVPIMADESCFGPRDAVRLVRANAVDMINIKLMKSGGLFPALEIEAVARAAGLPCMVGCMMESRVGIAAGAALVAARENIVYGDLDSTMFLAESGAIRGGFVQHGALYQLGEAPGHGVAVDF